MEPDTVLATLRLKIEEAYESSNKLRESPNISTENEIYNSGRCDAFEDVLGFLDKVSIKK